MSLFLYIGALRLVVQSELNPLHVGPLFGGIAGVLGAMECMYFASVVLSLVVMLGVGTGVLIVMSILDGWKYWVGIPLSLVVIGLASAAAPAFDEFLEQDACLDSGGSWQLSDCEHELPAREKVGTD